MPRLILLHAANTTPAAFAKLVGPVEGFECVYPQATSNLRWQHLGDSPDVAALLKIEADFICGMSSGAFMCARMLEEKQYRGAMMVAGGFIKALRPRPTPLMLVHGTADAQVPYEGSQYVLGAFLTCLAMRQALGNTKIPKHKAIPNTNGFDGCTTYLDSWGNVRLYSVEGGGHTWPTGTRTVWQPPEAGRVCHDFDATAAMSEWFRTL